MTARGPLVPRSPNLSTHFLTDEPVGCVQLSLFEKHRAHHHVLTEIEDSMSREKTTEPSWRPCAPSLPVHY